MCAEQKTDPHILKGGNTGQDAKIRRKFVMMIKQNRQAKC